MKMETYSMDEREQDNVAAFDMLFTTNQMQIMKMLLPYFDRPMQKYLAIFIKYQELQYTISYFKNHTCYIDESPSDKSPDIKKILPSLLLYCNDSQKKMIQQFEQILSFLDTYKEVSEMMEVMKDMTDASDAGEDSEASGGMQMPDMDMLLSMLSPQQQEIIELLKGGSDHE